MEYIFVVIVVLNDIDILKYFRPILLELLLKYESEIGSCFKHIRIEYYIEKNSYYNLRPTLDLMKYFMPSLSSVITVLSL